MPKEKKEKKKKYPEVWYIFDGAEDYLGKLTKRIYDLLYY